MDKTKFYDFYIFQHFYFTITTTKDIINLRVWADKKSICHNFNNLFFLIVSKGNDKLKTDFDSERLLFINIRGAKGMRERTIILSKDLHDFSLFFRNLFVRDVGYKKSLWWDR